VAPGFSLRHGFRPAPDIPGIAGRERRRDARVAAPFRFACVDWSERRPHIGGALGAALLKLALKRKWVVQDLDSRALEVTGRGRRKLLARFGLHS
jgi:hypothetical protein